MARVFASEDPSWFIIETSLVDNPSTNSSATNVNHDFPLLR